MNYSNYFSYKLFDRFIYTKDICVLFFSVKCDNIRNISIVN